MSAVSSILAIVSEGTGAVWSDAKGAVLDVAGEIDGETVSAVVAMSNATLDEASDLLCLGSLEGWSIVTESKSLHVHRHGGGFVAVTGAPTKNPEATLQKLAG